MVAVEVIVAMFLLLRSESEEDSSSFGIGSRSELFSFSSMSGMLISHCFGFGTEARGSEGSGR